MIRASVSVSNGGVSGTTFITAAVSYAQPVVDVSYILLTASAATDDLGAYRRLRDIAVISEAVVLGVHKYLTDSVEATDDFDGAASTLDDQEMQFAKILADVPQATDIFTRIVAYAREFSESSTASDSPALGISKPVQDAAETTDDQTTQFGKYVSDSVGATDDFDGVASTQDDQEMQFVKVRIDTASASEAFSRVAAFFRAFTETNETSDAVILSTGLLKADAAEVSDSFSRVIAFDRQPADSAQAAESNVFLIGLGKADTANASETLVKSGSMVRSDSAESADSGTLLNQDYTSDPFYFADDYVGTKRTF